jgi:hypothetical protein
VLQKTIGKTTRRGTDVQACFIGDIQLKGVEGTFQLKAAPAGKWHILAPQLNIILRTDQLTRFNNRLIVYQDGSRHDHGLCPLTAGNQAFIDKEMI